MQFACLLHLLPALNTVFVFPCMSTHSAPSILSLLCNRLFDTRGRDNVADKMSILFHFSPRTKFYWTCISPVLKWVSLGYGLLAAITWVRDELLPGQWRTFRVIDLLPSWPLYLWLAIGIIILAIALGEGVFRHHRLAEEAEKKHKPLFDSYGNPLEPLPARGKVSSLFIPSIILLTIMVVWATYSTPRTATTPEEKEILKPTEAPTALFMECNMASLPLTIPPHTTIHLIQLNKKRLQSAKWGFYDVPNDSNLARQWPDKAVINKATKLHNPGIFIWRCEISNHGTLNVFDVAVPIKIWFGNEKPEVIYQAIISPLDAGEKLVFYPVNDCPETVSAIWPDTVKLQVLGEPHRREVFLHRTFKSPIDQIMMFLASTTRFIGGEPCE